MFDINRRARSPAAALLVFLFAFLVLLLFMDLRPVLYDEGIILSHTQSVAAGAVPHRDMNTNYGPA